MSMGVFFTVPHAHVVIIQRLGKFVRVVGPGLRFRLPFVEKIRPLDGWGDVANRDNIYIEMSEQQVDTPPRECHTKDNVSVRANASVYWRIIDPRKAVYEVDTLPRVIHDIALNALRSNIGTLSLDKVLSERQRLNDRIADQLRSTAESWGVEFTRVEIQELTTSDTASDAMLQEMSADRRRRAKIAESEGTAQAEIKLARARAEAKIELAKAEATALNLITGAEKAYLQSLVEIIGKEQAGQLLLAQKFLTSLEKITDNPAHKVFLPTNMTGPMLFESVSQNVMPTPPAEPTMAPQKRFPSTHKSHSIGSEVRAQPRVIVDEPSGE